MFSPTGPYFSILRAAIWNTPVDITAWPRTIDWQPILDNFRHQAMLPLVADALCRLPQQYAITPEQNQQLLNLTAQNLRMRYKSQQVIQTVFTTLNQAGITPILLKGEGLALLYPMPNLRSVGDIDLIVPHDQYLQAVHILQNLSGDTGREDFLERHYQLTLQDITLEIHHHPGWAANGAYEKPFQTLSDHYLNSSNSSNPSNPSTPHPQYNALYVFNHLLHHMHDGGIGLRQFVDWALVLNDHAEHIDHQQLHRDLQNVGLLRPWQILGGILVYQLGLPQSAFPLYNETLARKSQGKYLHRILDGGNFGQQLRTPKDPTIPAPLRIWHNLLATLRQTAFLWTLFPSGALSFARNTFITTFRHHSGQLHDKQF